MLDIDEIQCGCLYYSSNKLARIIGKMADEEFRITGLSPAYAFLISVVNEKEGISQKKLGEVLHITASTTTRFIDKLENGFYLERKSEGKNSFIYLTEKGKKLENDINTAWSNLHNRYEKYLGEDDYNHLTEIINNACSKLD